MMSFDTVLYILFVVLVLLIFFGDNILIYFRGKKESGKREKGKTAAPSLSPQKEQQKPVQPKSVSEKKTETIEKTEKKPEETPFEPTKPKPKPKPKPEPKPKPKPKPELKPEPELKPSPEPKPVAKPIETPRAAKKLPNGEYPPFDNSRLLGMGLSQEDADQFVGELIEQVDTQIPLIQTAIENDDYKNLERLTHSIKGSSTNLGTGGIADLLIDFNTYCKKGKDKEIINLYFGYLEKYLAVLKNQFS